MTHVSLKTRKVSFLKLAQKLEVMYFNWLWHRRFCHINFDNIVKVSNTFVVRDLPKITKPTNIIFKECILAKLKKV